MPADRALVAATSRLLATAFALEECPTYLRRQLYLLRTCRDASPLEGGVEAVLLLSDVERCAELPCWVRVEAGRIARTINPERCAAWRAVARDVRALCRRR